MTVKEQYISTTEFAKRYNATRPIDEHFMPLEPSFVKLLCEQDKIEHSVLPANDGRKKDIYMIPVHELETVDILLNSNEAIPQTNKPSNAIDSKEAAAILGVDRSYVNILAKKGKLKSVKVETQYNDLGKNLFDEAEVRRYAEEHPIRRYDRKAKPKNDIPTEVPVEPGTDIQIEELAKANRELRLEILRLTEENEKLKQSSADAFNKTIDILNTFEAYRRGFKDGFLASGTFIGGDE